MSKLLGRIEAQIFAEKWQGRIKPKEVGMSGGVAITDPTAVELTLDKVKDNHRSGGDIEIKRESVAARFQREVLDLYRKYPFLFKRAVSDADFFHPNMDQSCFPTPPGGYQYIWQIIPHAHPFYFVPFHAVGGKWKERWYSVIPRWDVKTAKRLKVPVDWTTYSKRLLGKAKRQLTDSESLAHFFQEWFGEWEKLKRGFFEKAVLQHRFPEIVHGFDKVLSHLALTEDAAPIMMENCT